MKNLARWFTDGRRQAIQAAIVSLAPLVVLSGYLTQDQATAGLAVSGAVLQLVQGLVALSLLRPSDAARWFSTVGRGLIYALAAAVGPAGVALRFWGVDTAGAILTVTGLALTALAAVVQIVNVQTVDPIDGGSTDDGAVPVITSLPDPSDATRVEYQSALERAEED